MLNLTLAPTDDLASPLFKDTEGCARWLEQLQLTNLHLAHSLLLTQTIEFNRYQMRGQERFKILELLRDTVHYVQNEYAKKLIAKPLPLNDHELNIFLAIVQLWQAMAVGYQRCLQGHLSGDKPVDKQGALLCQRSLLYSGSAIFEHLRAGYEFDARLWNQLHELYAFVEAQDLQLKEIADPLNDRLRRSITSDLAAVVMQPSRMASSSISCHDVYVKILLACYARPAELGRSQLLLLNTWLSAWSKLVPIALSYTISKGDAQPLALDLGSSNGLQPVKLVVHSATMRYLALVPLSKLIRVKTILLQQGRAPEQAELDCHCNADECIELLTYLHQCWCEDNYTRFSERKPGSRQVRLCCKPESIYAVLSGKPYRQSMHTPAAHTAQKQLEAFGQVLQNSADKAHSGSGFPLETWQIENESILGAKLTRIDSAGDRLSHNQLLALGTDDDEGIFRLGTTTWVNMTRTRQLRIGVRYLPGTVKAVVLATADPDLDAAQRTAPGFLLQAVPALKSPASLIIPRNWFKPGRVVEIKHQSDERQNATIGFSVEHGIDYERVSFTLVQ